MNKFFNIVYFYGLFEYRLVRKIFIFKRVVRLYYRLQIHFIQMNNEIKILLSINLQGGSFQRSENGEITVPDVVKRIQMTKDAYEYMTSDEIPEWYHRNKGEKPWKKLSNIQKINVHMKRMCEHFKGKSYTFKILDD